jgi:formate dehydrogenase subunit delta
MKTADMVRMANQIAVNLQVYGDGAAAAVADHLRSFWEARMRAALDAHARAGGDGLHPLVMQAVRLLDTGTSR